MGNQRMPHSCPSCSSDMVIVKLMCPDCGTEISGEFCLCPVCRLDDRLRELFDSFMKARGNLRQVQKELNVSYPTARLRIEEMFRHVCKPAGKPDAKQVLRKLRNGQITVDEAESLLRGS